MAVALLLVDVWRIYVAVVEMGYGKWVGLVGVLGVIKVFALPLTVRHFVDRPPNGPYAGAGRLVGLV